ncbi:MAG TPA: hypothetical protein VJ927_08690 [Actinomycetota bacterium]|nr:hypothetical protein [Actinomycetota bacterium]
MIKRSMAAVALAVTMVPFVGSVALAADPTGAADTNIKERVECMFRVYIQEGGESGLDCLT